MRIATALLTCFLSCAAWGQAYEVTQPDSDIALQDLEHLGDALGVKMDLYDYDIDVPHCLKLWATVETENQSQEELRHVGICSTEGPHRITVQWRETDDQVKLHFFVHRRDSVQGTSVGMPPIETPAHNGWSKSFVPDLALEMDLPTQLTDGIYQQFDHVAAQRLWRKQVRVFAELKPNPERTIGTRYDF